MNYTVYKSERVMKGVTLIELTVIIIILVILAGAAVPRLTSIFEDADAQILRAVAAETQLAISAGLNRGKNYHQLTTNGMGFMDDILNHVEETYGGVVKAEYDEAATFTVSVVGKGDLRTASYIVANNGKVMITDASGFDYYFAYAGDLVKIQTKSNNNTVIASAAASTLQSIGQVFGGTSDESLASADSSASSTSSSSSDSSASSASNSSSGSSASSASNSSSANKGNNGKGNAYGKDKGNNGKGNAYGRNNNPGRGNAYAYGRPVASPF